ASGDPRALHSFPTRRSSDLSEPVPKDIVRNYPRFNVERIEPIMRWVQDEANDHFFIAGMGWTFDQYGNLVQDYKRRYGDIRHLRSEEHTSELQSRENLVCRL